MYYRIAREAVRVYQSAKRALWRLCWYSGILKEHSRGVLEQSTIGAIGRHGTAENNKSTQEVVLVQQSTKGALGMLCWWNRVL